MFKRKRKIAFIVILISIYLIIKIAFDQYPSLVNIYEKNFKENTAVSSQDKFYGKKYVVISATLEHFKDHYMFQIPLVTQAWRRLNFEPIIFVVAYNNTPNKLAEVVLKYLKILNVKVVNIQTKVNNYEVIIGMVSRLFCGLLPDYLVKDNDFIITSDTDLFPISEDYFTFDSSDSIKLWNHGSCDDFEYRNKMYEMHTLLHIGMLKRQWKEVMQLDFKSDKLDGDSVLNLIKKMYGDSYLKQNHEIQRGDQKSQPYWFLDQMTISVKIHNYVNVDKKTTVNKIKYRGTRLNRGPFYNAEWTNQYQIKYLTDFHSFHGDVFEKWSILREFLTSLLAKSYLNVFDEYFLDYMSVKDNEPYFKNKPQNQ